MIRKRPSADLKEEVTAAPVTRKAGAYVEIPLPKFSSGNYTPLLMIALFVAAYLLGMLTTKVQYLEKTKTASATDTASVTTQQTPQQPNALQKVQATAGHLPVKGNKDAKVTIIEFSDFQCPFCKSFFDDTYGQVLKEYVDTGKAKIAYRHFPLVSIHPNAQKAAEASECANEQDKFWEYHDLLFKNQEAWSAQAVADAATSFTTYAGELGLNTGQFSECVTSGKYAKAVNDDAADAQKANVSATPSFVINDELLVGAMPFASFQAAIDAKL